MPILILNQFTNPQKRDILRRYRMSNNPNLDKDMIFKRLHKLDEVYEKLVDLQSLSQEDYLSNYRNLYSSQRLLEFAINICIDIGAHVESVLVGKAPETFIDIWINLNKNNYISDQLTNKMKEMVRFRNKLGHYYMDIDDSMVYIILKENIDDFLKFKQEIMKILEK